jgi:hypothetical protein
MTLDDLKAPWVAEVSRESTAQRLDNLQSDVARLRRDVRMRDVWMILPLLASAAISVFFNWWAAEAISFASGISMLAIVILTTVVIIVLLNARRAAAHDTWTLRARLEREIEAVGRQGALLLNIGYWFLLPMFLMIVITSTLGHHEQTGSYLPNAALLGLYVGSLSISVLALWLCRREAKRRFLPLLSRLRELHHDLVCQSGVRS